MYGIDDSIVDAKRIVGGLSAPLLLAVLTAAGCNQRVDLGAIGDGPASLLWKATFEPGNLSEWTGDGQGGTYVENDMGGDAVVTTAQAHGGTHAGLVAVTPSGSMPSISYLIRNQPTPAQAYYSAWFYVPSTVVVGSYLSLVHFRGSTTGDGQNLYAIWDVNLYPVVPGTLAAQLYDFTNQKDWPQSPTSIAFPVDRWVQLEVYFSQAIGPTGRITVWQDGTLILDRPAMQTVATDWLQWDVGGASDNLVPSPSVVYLDDAAISLVRLGPDTLL